MPISSSNARYINDPTTDAAFFFLLTITSESEPPIYLVNNLEAVTSRGISFQPYPFALTLPNDDTTKSPTVQIVVDNVDQRLVELVRSMPSAPSVKVELITSKFPDLVEREIDYLKIRSVEYDAFTIKFTLEIQNILARKYPEGSYDPIQFPDLFYALAIAVQTYYGVSSCLT